MNGHDNARPASGCDMRQRSPKEIADQLERDAVSLTLTGASFEKDRVFYETVAANVREAIGWLQQWEPLLEMMRKEQAAARTGLVRHAWSMAADVAIDFEGAAPKHSAWAGACHALCMAFIARSESCAEEAQSGLEDIDREALKAALIGASRRAGEFRK